MLISTLLTNEGNIHIRKKEFGGVITILNSEDEAITEIDISRHNILPSTGYALNELWTLPNNLKDNQTETYTVEAKVSVKSPHGETVKVAKSVTISL